MGEPIRVLIVDSSHDDALLVIDHLWSGGYDPTWERVDKAASMEAALEAARDGQDWDVVIAEQCPPDFSLFASLAILRARALDTPFIIVSDAIDEETAIAALRAGAQDYIKKTSLARLVPSIERGLAYAVAKREHRKVEEALIESVQTSMEAVHAIPSGLFIYKHKPPGKLILVFGNPEAERLTGIKVDECLGKEFNEIWPEAERMGITKSFLDVLRTGDAIETRDIAYDDGHTEGVFRTRVFPMAGTRLGVAFENVTQQKKTLEALAWESDVNAAMADLSEALIESESIEDVSSLLLDYAKRLTESEFGYVGHIDTLTGYLISTTMTKDIWDTCRVPDKDIVFEKFHGLWGWVLDNREPLLTNSPHDDTRSTGTPEGHIPVHRFLSAPAMIGDELAGQVALANSSRDYSDRDLKLVKRLAGLYAIAIRRYRGEQALRESEHKYRELSGRLEEKVKAKVAELKQVERLAAVGRMVSIVAHEVRNPLQNIQMGVDAMRDRIDGDQDRIEILEEIDYGVNLLNGIISELLDYSRPMTLERSLSPVGDLVAPALKAMAHRLDGIEVRLELEDGDREVLVDPTRMRSALVNLISNAVESMPSGGKLTICSSFHPDGENSALKISVIDTGDGIDSEDLKQIFEPFFTTRTKGTGLGIPVCEKILDAHNGRLSITSHSGKGTTAEIFLPTEISPKHGQVSA